MRAPDTSRSYRFRSATASDRTISSIWASDNSATAVPSRSLEPSSRRLIAGGSLPLRRSARNAAFVPTKPYLSALIPVYNEEENLPALGEEVSAALNALGKP